MMVVFGFSLLSTTLVCHRSPIQYVCMNLSEKISYAGRDIVSPDTDKCTVFDHSRSQLY
jgi:uncharacterized protein (UPF0179 family)